MAEQSSSALVAFEQERGRLFGIAYRMLGSVSEAEDVLQDAYIRWHGVAHAQVEQPTAYLIRLVTHLCLDLLGTAQRRRTEYVGTWLPEPLIQQQPLDHDPASLHEMVDDLSQAFLLVLERLSPVERAVFVLHEALDFSYREIGEIVGKTEENCRQIARRARQHIAVEHYAPPADPAQHDQLLTRFLIATQTGDLDGLLAVLADEATAYSDGGGKARAATRPIEGAERVARFMLGLRGKAQGLEHRLAIINGRTGVLNILDGRIHSTVAFHVVKQRIQAVFIVINPDKLPQDY